MLHRRSRLGSTWLVSFRSCYSVQPNSNATNFQRIPIDDPSGSRDGIPNLESICSGEHQVRNEDNDKKSQHSNPAVSEADNRPPSSEHIGQPGQPPCASSGIGGDLCQVQPDSVVEWIRNGRWSRGTDYAEGSAGNAGFPPQPEWSRDNRDFGNLAGGLRAAGFAEADVAAIMGGNWLDFFGHSFGPA